MNIRMLPISLCIACLCLGVTGSLSGAADSDYRNPAGHRPPGLERQDKVPPGQYKKMDDRRDYRYDGDQRRDRDRRYDGDRRRDRDHRYDGDHRRDRDRHYDGDHRRDRDHRYDNDHRRDRDHRYDKDRKHDRKKDGKKDGKRDRKDRY